MRHHLGQPGRAHAARQPCQHLARHVHVDQHARHLDGGHRHRFFRHLGVEMVAGDEEVDHVEIGFRDTVELDDALA